MNEFSNEEYLNITPKYNNFGKTPIMVPTLSKADKNKIDNNIFKKSQKKMHREKDQLFLDHQRNSIHYTKNIRSNFPNIITSLTPIEKRNHYKRISFAKKNKSNNKNSCNSRNFEFSMLNYHNSDNINFFEKAQLNDAFHLKKINKIKNNKYNKNESEMNLRQILLTKNKNNMHIGNKNLYSRNIENISKKMNLNSNYFTQNNKNASTKNYNNNKMKFSLNKKNLMHTIKKPSKINLEKKNIKYKIPLDQINNYNYGKKKFINNFMEEGRGNSRKLNIKKINNKSTNKEIIDCSNNDNQNNEEEDIKINDPKDFINSTLIVFNDLVSQAKELGQILIDNKVNINIENNNELNNNNKLKESSDEINDIINLNVNSKINKLNQEIKNEKKSVEELQKIISDLNNKINLFNKNSQQYENKVKELVTMINQIKNSNNNANNSNRNSGNYSNGIGIDNFLKKDSSFSVMLENKPKKKKAKFGFVETIFMKDDKFELIVNKKSPKYNIFNKEKWTINKINKKPKLKFVNINKEKNPKEKGKDKANEEDYLDAASQIANQIIIETLIYMENEDEE